MKILIRILIKICYWIEIRFSRLGTKISNITGVETLRKRIEYDNHGIPIKKIFEELDIWGKVKK